MLFIMNEIEMRRLQLLENTRNSYNNKYSPPAIHPRYHAAYSSLYKDEEKTTYMKHTWFIRCVVAIIIFTLFFVMNKQNEQIGTIDSAVIVHEIKRDLLSQ